MRFCLFIICLFSFQQTVSAQDQDKKSEIFLELGGNGLLGSINYSRKLFNNPALEFRAGLGAYGSDPKTYLTVPVGLNYIINISSKHAFLNVGFGGTYTRADVTMGILKKYQEGYKPRASAPVNIIPNFGYRYYTTKDFSWRINFSPVINRHGFLPLFGISGGKRF